MLLIVKDNKIIGILGDLQNADKKVLNFFPEGSEIKYINDDFKYNPPVKTVVDTQNGLPIPPITQEREFIQIGDDMPIVAKDFTKTYYKEIRNINYDYYGEQLGAIIKGFKVLKSNNINIGPDMEELINKIDEIKLKFPKS